MKRNNWKEIEEICKSNGITELYHFTDKANIDSIIQNNGLYSWETCRRKNININKPGGNDLSRELEIKKSLTDYIHLSFTPQHPMLFNTINDGRISDPILLTIDIEVIYFDETLFSNQNAISKNAKIGSDINDLKKINFDIILNNRYFDLEDEDEQELYQAEILVKSFIDIKYIKNIHNIENLQTQNSLKNLELIFKLPDCIDKKFNIVNQFFRIEDNGIGNSMRKLHPWEKADPDNPKLRIFNVIYIESIINPFAIELGALNNIPTFQSIIHINNGTFSINPRARISSRNGILSFKIV